MSINREKLSAGAFLADMAYKFPWLFFGGGLVPEEAPLELAVWIRENRHELKTNILKNCEREATISVCESLGVKP